MNISPPEPIDYVNYALALFNLVVGLRKKQYHGAIGWFMYIYTYFFFANGPQP